MMQYFKNRMRILRSEYTAPDREEFIASMGGKCSLCSRKNGDAALFGPTHYLKKKLRFKVYMDIHVIEGGPAKDRRVVLCSFCHSGYHLMNRLSENAILGGKSLSSTIYKRCRRCYELTCRCCSKCKKNPKWCKCRKARKR
jgi:hypothetical protein